jgi:hypothetical protein
VTELRCSNVFAVFGALNFSIPRKAKQQLLGGISRHMSCGGDVGWGGFRADFIQGVEHGTASGLGSELRCILAQVQASLCKVRVGRPDDARLLASL